jgi:hypothetical protein
LRKKKILFLLLGLAVIYVFWLSIQIVRFKTYTNPTLEESSLEIRGAYHIHTIHSDGRKTPEKIAELASRSSLDFIILTDHGSPNSASMAEAGWKNGVLVLAGSELSVSRGHLVALGFTPPSVPFSHNAEQASYQIKALSGISIIAHPYSKVSWSWGKPIDYSGMEIINANSLLKYNFLRALPFLPSLLLKPEYALLKMLKRPVKNLNKWDELNLIQPTTGFYSVDAHLLYQPLLSFLQLHVLLNNRLSEKFEIASRQVFSALRQGRFYNAVDYAARARGFRFWAQKDKKIIQMGEKAIFDADMALHIRAEFPFSFEVNLIHNGKKIMASTEKRIVYQPAQPGFYRVEVYLKERTSMRENIPWILSNPIYFWEKYRDKNEPPK